MDWGMANRLARVFQPTTGRTVMLALDHGYFLGPTTRLEVPRKTIEPLAPYADALMLTRGVLRTSVDPRTSPPIVLRVSGGSSIIGETLSDEGLTVSMRDAVKLNVAGVGLSIFVGTPHEKQTLLNLGKLVDEGEDLGIPVLAITAVGRELEKRDATFLSLCCRIAAELGAHFVKTYYCENFVRVAETCPVPVVVAGGPKLPEKEALQLTVNAIQEGAAGVDMGRNIWQADHPVAMIRAIRAIVHEGADLKTAWDVFESVRGEVARPRA